jgi:putative hemolysin
MNKTTVPIMLLVLVAVLAVVYYFAFGPGAADPVATNCAQLNGTLVAEGGVTICNLPDGRVCEAEGWYRTGICLPPNTGAASTTPETGSTNPPNSAEGAPEGSIHNLPVPPAVAAAKARAAADVGVAMSQVLVLSAHEREWPNGCLGLEQAGEMCTQALVPGWEVTVQAKGMTHIYRTNENGTVIRKQS